MGNVDQAKKGEEMKTLDISDVPYENVFFSWLSKVTVVEPGRPKEIIISERQSKGIFSSLAGQWKFYRGIPLKIKKKK